jgi:hypothetical protein
MKRTKGVNHDSDDQKDSMENPVEDLGHESVGIYCLLRLPYYYCQFQDSDKNLPTSAQEWLPKSCQLTSLYVFLETSSGIIFAD